MKTGQVYQGDCLVLMDQIKDHSIDMILCDPPFGKTANKWDKILPFDRLWEHYKRIIKPNGVIVLFAMQPFTSMVVMSNLEWFKYDWVWKKGGAASGFLNAKKQPLRDKEDILVFYEGQAKYNPQMGKGTPYKRNRKIGWAGGNYGKIKSEPCINDDRTRYPKQVLEFQRVERGKHPNQKPTKLLEYLIRTYTDKGEIVLDNCCGSGSTGVACVNTNRQFILIEKEEEYVAIARKRIEKAKRKKSQSFGLFQ